MKNLLIILFVAALASAGFGQGTSIYARKHFQVSGDKSNLLIEFKNIGGDSLPGSMLLYADTIEIEVKGEGEDKYGHFKIPLDEYQIKSFTFTTYWAGTDIRYNVKGSILPEKLVKIIKGRLSNGKDLTIWIEKLILLDPDENEFKLRDFKFVTY